MKPILKYLLIILLLGGGYIAFEWNSRVTRVIPIPYDVKLPKIKREAPVVIIGDRLGKRLAQFREVLIDVISKNLDSKIKIQDLTGEGDGIHRSLAKLKSMDSPPLLVIYIGGSQEWYESKYRLRDIDSINSNFARYENPWVQTLIKVVPDLSKFLYSKAKIYHLGNQIKTKSVAVTADKRLASNTLEYKIYRYELQNLFEYLTANEIKFVGVTQPLNLDIPPKINCPGSFLTQGISPTQVEQSINSGDFKTAVTMAKDMVMTSPSYALSYYTLGKAYYAQESFKDAFNNMQTALAYDCKNWRGNPIYNILLKSVASAYHFNVFDFQKFIYDYWGKNELFMDEIFPQDIYWEHLTKIVGTKARTLLKL
jgi:hypothetical protein